MWRSSRLGGFLYLIRVSDGPMHNQRIMQTLTPNPPPSLSLSLSHTHTHEPTHPFHASTHTLWHKSLLACAWWRKTFWFAFSPFCTSYSAQRCLDEQRLSFCNHCTFDLIIFLYGLYLSVATKRRLWECLSYYVH